MLVGLLLFHSIISLKHANDVKTINCNEKNIIIKQNSYSGLAASYRLLCMLPYCSMVLASWRKKKRPLILLYDQDIVFQFWAWLQSLHGLIPNASKSNLTYPRYLELVVILDAYFFFFVQNRVCSFWRPLLLLRTFRRNSLLLFVTFKRSIWLRHDQHLCNQ
jgi:hypothetical protein